MTDAYRQFLEEKVAVAPSFGFSIDDAEIHPILKPHQRAIVRWMVAGGRRACFAAFGLGKSVIQIEAVRLTQTRAGGRGLIVAPLGVRQEFMRDAAMLGVSITFIRTTAEAVEPNGLYLTNYESVREGKIDPLAFTVASLDEASCLRGFGGTKTFRQFMALFAGDDRAAGVKHLGVPYRYVATATPSPNEYIELLAYSAYLDVMDVGQAKTRFFKRNSEKADQLTIHAHKEAEFWLWLASWALFVQRPSDIDPAFSDDGYQLPPLDVRWHEVPTDHRKAGVEKDGQGKLFANAAIGVLDASREKRASMGARISKLMEILHGGESDVQQGVLREESGSDAGIAEESGQRARRARSGRGSSVSSGVLRSESGSSACAAARKGSAQLSGEPEGAPEAHAEGAAQAIRPDAVRVSGSSRQPGRRLRHLHSESADAPHGRGSLPPDGQSAGDSLHPMQYRVGAAGGFTGSDPGSGGLPEQVVLWCDLNDEQREIELALTARGITVTSLSGAQDVDSRDVLLSQWRARETSALLSKPSMYGAGVNLQQASTMAFVGIGFKAQDILQAIHRIYRFLQTRTCTIHFIYTEAERDIRAQLERKWEQHNIMVAKMTDIIREFGLAHAASASALARSLGVERVAASGESYRMVNNDCVEETSAMDADSVDLIVTSIPFATQYEYTPSYNDFGHTDDNAHFWAQMDFLIPNLLRVLRPGRVAAIHVKDRITPGGINGFGFQTVQPFSDECIAAFVKHGFAFLARKTIVTDVVRENNQTYRLGWTEQCKDGSRMGAGMPEYMLIFRKPPTDRSNGYADLPVVKSKADFTRPRWQFDAHGFMRSSGNRPLLPEDLEGLDQAAIFQLFRRHSLEQVYDFRHDVAIAEIVDKSGWLPSTFMLLQPQSWHPDVWTDITRMRTLNATQAAKGREMHLCPLQFDIVDRCIEQYSMPGETVLDPFAGLGTVPYCAIKLRRRGIGIELNNRYFLDAAAYCAGAERDLDMPDLFGVLEAEERKAA